MAAAEFMLTTLDNPFDPFDNFSEWYKFDMDKGYDTCGYLARISKASSELTDEENREENNRAISEILKIDPTGLYLRVEKGKFVKPKTSDLSKILK